MSYSITPLGDSALTVDFGNIISDEINAKVLLLVHAIEKAGLPNVKDIVPAYSSVSVFYDTIALLKRHKNKSAYSFMSDQVEALLSQSMEAVTANFRTVKVPVCYSPKYGLDMADISEQTKLSVEEIIHLHTAKKYKVYMIGFLPGFAYMGNVDERIAVPRKLEPRQKIEAGSVGIAGKQTGIYPVSSPGGWQIIGRTPIKLFDKEKEEPVFFRPGDEVKFYSITENEFDNY
ncbi:MAG: pxpB [Segetibacter sp.]|nr:pxpB [Segetibacter sp.]